MLAYGYEPSYNQGGMQEPPLQKYRKGIVMSDLKKFGENIIGNLERVIVGKSQSLELVVMVCYARDMY